MDSIAGSVAPPQPRPDPSPGDGWVPRFGRTARFAHWWTVAMVLIALLTGLGMGDDSGSGFMRWLHVGAVVMIGVGLIVAAAVGDHRELLTSAHQLFRFDRRDLRWVSAHVRQPLGRHPQPRWGLFNTGQKILAWALTGSMAAVIFTGILAWSSGEGEGGLHGTAVVITMVFLGAHVFMATANPSTRPALAGMVFGRVRRSWAAIHHRAWLDDIDERTNQSSELASTKGDSR